jgi:hypothetical protein
VSKTKDSTLSTNYTKRAIALWDSWPSMGVRVPLDLSASRIQLHKHVPRDFGRFVCDEEHTSEKTPSFGGTYYLHPQGLNVNQVKNPKKQRTNCLFFLRRNFRPFPNDRALMSTLPYSS